MAATCVLRLVGEVTGIDDQLDFHVRGDLATTPTKRAEMIQIQATTNTAEALNLGGVTTPLSITIEALDNAVDIDTSYVSAFAAEITLKEGEFATFTPSGTVYIKNNVTGEVCTIHSVIVGT